MRASAVGYLNYSLNVLKKKKKQMSTVAGIWCDWKDMINGFLRGVGRFAGVDEMVPRLHLRAALTRQ